MGDQTIEVDYLVVGAGSAEMSFADSLFTEPSVASRPPVAVQ